MTAHAVLSPSGASGWMRCAPKLAMEFGLPDSSSEFADEGTAAHFLASECLEAGAPAETHIGKTIVVWSDSVTHKRGTDWGHNIVCTPETGGYVERRYDVDEDMAGHVQTYIDAIHTRIESFKLRGAVSVDMLVEIRVNFSVFVYGPGSDQPEAFGTSDVILLVSWPDGTMQVDVNDLKYGRGVVVYAANRERAEEPGAFAEIDPAIGNEQMMIYALGAYDQFAGLGDVAKVSWCVHQPRLNFVDAAECSAQALLGWAESMLRPAAERAMQYFDSREFAAFSMSDFSPGEKQCMWCKAKGSCKAAAGHAFATIVGDFADLDAPIAEQVAGAMERVGHLPNEKIGEMFDQADFIESWIKAVRARTEAELFAGREVPSPNGGYKLVQGKQGNRAWSDPAAAEAKLKSMRLKQDEMYTFKLISPTAAEKLAPRKAKTSPKGGEYAMGVKTPLGVKQWAALQELITRSPGVPSVAPMGDSRPAIAVAPPEDAFVNLEGGDDGNEFV